jgi:RNA polymerase sigma-70 factor, ECF subfamily
MSNAVDNLEPQWVFQAQKGDAEAFAQLVEAYQRPVFNLCYRMLGDAYEAEDAAQEAFLRAYNNMKRYDPQRPFSTWLLSIAAHHCIDQIRKRRFPSFSLDDDEAPYLEPPDSSPGPEALLGLREDQVRVKQLLASLNPHDRAAVVMFYWYELSYEEIAAALNLTVSAVKSRLHRARLALANTWIVQEGLNTASERTNNGKAQSPAF